MTVFIGLNGFRLDELAKRPYYVSDTLAALRTASSGQFPQPDAKSPDRGARRLILQNRPWRPYRQLLQGILSSLEYIIKHTKTA